ncbi:hypothetical protein B0H17DRAFT_1143006 [Mycena rosella]|uniref:Uncharacterized protein n=1 Tax=Mycena rosella TaxID=1033263 RepID=A0AAD7G8R2_MYCRO|nr:hypothetical protein B0H17DRAFT_1143006 [Mycena rosella]
MIALGQIGTGISPRRDFSTGSIVPATDMSNNWERCNLAQGAQEHLPGPILFNCANQDFRWVDQDRPVKRRFALPTDRDHVNASQQMAVVSHTPHHTCVWLDVNLGLSWLPGRPGSSLELERNQLADSFPHAEASLHRHVSGRSRPAGDHVPGKFRASVLSLNPTHAELCRSLRNLPEYSAPRAQSASANFMDLRR